MDFDSKRTRETLFARALARRPRFWLMIGALLASLSVIRSMPADETRNDTNNGQPTPSTTPPPGDVRALARLEPLSGLMIIGARPGARIGRIEVAEGDRVKAGQLLAILEGHDQASAQVALAEAQKARAVHGRETQKKKLALEREKFDKLQKARNEMAMRVLASKALFDDIADTFKKLQPTLQGKERLEAEMKYLETETRNLKDSLEVRTFQVAGELTPKQRQLEDDELGETSPDLDVLDRQIDLARKAVAQAEIHAPSNGTVLDVMAHAGEVSGGPLIAMGDLSVMAAVAEVFQSDLPRLKLGDSASVSILDEQVEGRVTQLGAMVARNELKSLDPRALQDRRVVKVKIRLNDSSLAARLVNMEVEVAIRPGQTAAPAARAARP